MGATERWLVTGGAGYVGGHVVTALRAAGVEVVVLDDLSTGRADRLPPGVRLVQGSVGNRSALRSALRGVSGTVHLAALTSAPASVLDPLAYYRANVADVAVLLETMIQVGVLRLVASSSAAVYGGDPAEGTPGAHTEAHPTRPQSPYGTTKLVGELLIRDTAAASGLSAIALRYFNVAGAGSGELADTKTGGLMSNVLAARRHGLPVTVRGRAHPTPDGSAVRDFVHAWDVAAAHVAAVARLSSGWQGSAVYNVGTGRGVSVLEVLARTAALTGGPVPAVDGPPRPGDPSFSVAGTGLIERELGWRAQHDIDDCISSAWAASRRLSGRRVQLAAAR